MSGLIGGLTNAAKALAAQQAGVQIAGRNLANVNNPAYARQRVILGDRAVVMTKLGSAGTGVEALGVQQIRDRYLDEQVTRENSKTEALQAKQSALDGAETNLGETIDRSQNSSSIETSVDSSNGIGGALNSFFNGFEDFAAKPTDVGTKQVLLERTNLLASKFNVVDQRLAQQQSDLTSKISADASSASDLLNQIGTLNGEIQQAEIQNPGTAVDLRDQRQARLEDLAKYFDFTASTIPNGNGQIQVIAKDTNGADTVLVDKTTVYGGVTFSGSNFQGGSTGANLAFKSGSLSANVAVRDGELTKLRLDLQNTAKQITAAVNAAYNPTGTTGNLFAAAPSSGLLQVDPAVTVANLKSTDSGDAGANEIATAVAAVAQKKFTTTGGDLIDGTIASFYNQTVTGLASNLQSTTTQLADQTSVQSLISTRRDSVSAVSMDEEVSDLMKFQRAYQASAKVVGVIDSMLDTLVNGLGI